jgi:hypothetical protein
MAEQQQQKATDEHHLSVPSGSNVPASEMLNPSPPGSPRQRSPRRGGSGEAFSIPSCSLSCSSSILTLSPFPTGVQESIVLQALVELHTFMFIITSILFQRNSRQNKK